MSETQSEIVWLTQEAYDKLEAELTHLKTVGRPDVKENGGYHAAREEQGQMEGRIAQLEQLLRNAKVGEAVGDKNEAAPGKLITIAFDGDEDDTDTFLLGSREVLGVDDSVEYSVYSPQSPLGAAVTGAKVGDEVSYEAPNGRTINVTVLKVENL